uniref:Glycoside hydrolase family 13 n=1 Tax=Rhizophlyctis rosea TaxID=64517 RepID=A0A2U8U9Q2_9FUNG|nr:glycoside hydrolase family 13 [Rhizophlyctis rosea]
MGVTMVWIPPPTKGCGPDDVGYAVYDLWDLGEFDQKNTVPTKYGTKAELHDAIKAYAVMNHKLGADETETFKVVEVDRCDTTKDISGEQEITAWTKFLFPGRGDKYSKFKWYYNHFTGVDYDAGNQREGVFRILGHGKYWSNNVSTENGNYDYLMGADIDTAHPDVVADLKLWAVWLVEELGLSGLRLDALKHIDAYFVHDLLQHVRYQTGLGEGLFSVGEYWKADLGDLERYLDVHEWKLSLFDVPLHFNFVEAARKGKDYDIRQIFDGSLVQVHPMQAVTFVVRKSNNHDTQPGESLESFVDHWFQPLAYALILLRRDGYPCLFYVSYRHSDCIGYGLKFGRKGDIYGMGGPNPVAAHSAPAIKNIAKVRKYFAFGDQDDYFDHPTTIAWLRHGTTDDSILKEHPYASTGCIVILCTSDAGSKFIWVGPDRAGEEWVDVAGGRREVCLG